MSGRHRISALLLSTWILTLVVDDLAAQDLPEPITLPTPAAESNTDQTLPPAASADPISPAEISDPVQVPAGNAAPYKMVQVPKPKKPAPPAFPGPQTLPPVGPWKLMYFDNDFSYKKDPNHEYFLGEELKDMPLEVFGIPVLLSTGGEIRDRYMNESNRLRPGGIPIGKSTDYNLTR